MTVLDYIAELDRIFRRGNATEHSCRRALQALLHSHATNIQATALAQGGPAYPVSGDHIIEKIIYTPPKDATPGRVWINKTQYFEGIAPNLWIFQIGGYRVLEKWLKDRKGRILDHDDISRARRMRPVSQPYPHPPFGHPLPLRRSGANDTARRPNRFSPSPAQRERGWGEGAAFTAMAESAA